MVRCQVLVIGGDIMPECVGRVNGTFCFTGAVAQRLISAFTSEFKLRTNPVKAFSGTCVRLTATSITFSVIWSSVLISVT